MQWFNLMLLAMRMVARAACDALISPHHTPAAHSRALQSAFVHSDTANPCCNTTAHTGATTGLYWSAAVYSEALSCTSSATVTLSRVCCVQHMLRARHRAQPMQQCAASPLLHAGACRACASAAASHASAARLLPLRSALQDDALVAALQQLRVLADPPAGQRLH